MHVRELELDLDAFEGPFDLLLTLVLREELEPRDVDVADVVVTFVERLAEREWLDLDACGEFLVLVGALLELKARELFPEEQVELADLDPEEAAEELARRLEEFRRIKEAAGWLLERLERENDRYFRLGPAPLAPRAEPGIAPQQPEALAEALRGLAAEPPEVSLGHMGLRFPPVVQFLERFRALLRRRRRFDFDQEAAELTRLEQAVAFLALLELRKAGEIRDRAGRAFRADQSQLRPGFRPARAPSRNPVRRRGRRQFVEPPLRLISTNPVDELAHTLEALLVVASQPLTVEDLAVAADDDLARVEQALELLGERFSEGRSGIVLEHVAGGYAFRASRAAAEACARLFERPVERGLSQAAFETLAVIAYLGPCSRPDIARIRGVAADSVVAGLVERGLISESGRDEGGAVRYRTTPLFERVFGLESLSALPRLDDLGGSTDEIRDRLEAIAERRPA